MGVVGSRSFYPQTCQGASGTLFNLTTGMHLHIDHPRFAPFFGRAFDSAIACLGYRFSADMEWFFFEAAPRSFPNAFVDDQIPEFVDRFVLP